MYMLLHMNIHVHTYAYRHIHKNAFLPVPVVKEGTITWPLPLRSPHSSEGER